MRRLVVAALVLVAAAAPADAARIRALDTTGYPTIRATVVTAGATAAPTLLENGKRVAALHVQNLGAVRSIVLAIDRSRSMAGRRLADARSAARLFVSLMRPTDRVGVVAIGADAVELAHLTGQRGDAEDALETLRVDRDEGTALYDGVTLASDALAREQGGARIAILLTDGRDVSSSATLKSAIAAARDRHITVFAVGLAPRPAAAKALRRIANDTGGRYVAATSSDRLARIFGAIAAELRRTWQLDYATATRPGDVLHIQARVAGERWAAASVVMPGSRRSGEGGGGPTAGRWADLVLALSIGGLVVAATQSVATYRRVRALRRRLNVDEPAGEVEHRPGLRARVVARASGLFGATERTFGHARQWQALERALAQADLPLRAVELLYAMAATAFVLAVFALFAGAPFLLAVILAVAGGATPFGIVRLKGRKRIRAFDEQLPDLLLTLASALKAGQTFRQGLQTLVEEGHDPARKEFQRVLSEARLGRSLEDALRDMAERLGSENFRFVVSAVAIQRRVGGSLAGIFDMVSEGVRRRQQFARRLKALTAQGRMSAYVLMGLPIVLALALSLINPQYMSPLFATSAGHMLLAVGVVLMTIGGIVLKKIASFAE